MICTVCFQKVNAAKAVRRGLRPPVPHQRRHRGASTPASAARRAPLGINLSATFEASLRKAVRQQKAAQWLEENRAALHSSNEWIEKNGLPLEKYRQF